MDSVGTPKNGDVVIRSHQLDTKTVFVLSSVPGPDQFRYATRAEAARMARAYAEYAGVDVWLTEFPNEFTLLCRLRESKPRTSSVAWLARSVAPLHS
jgi:hypothetical protein